MGVGKDIVSLAVDNKYGGKFHATLSADLRKEMPGIEGLSETNIRYAKRHSVGTSYTYHRQVLRDNPTHDVQLYEKAGKTYKDLYECCLTDKDKAILSQDLTETV